DSVAFPEFYSGATEGWGLFVSQSYFILFNENKHSEDHRITVAVSVAPVVAHQWFGNLVTMEWWDDLWLNEGFATYVAYTSTNDIFPDWSMMEIFTFDTVSALLKDDSFDFSRPMISPADNTEDIMQNYDSISFYKGAALIQMLENVVGSDVFSRAINNYLISHQFHSATSDDLWAVFSWQVTKDCFILFL
ncbi:hypothetical protein HELRODRAFT_86010, partial [Helobdella robusta]|uniref:Peptidase M1 membrane alanine aminopeptidase domain-containing protein n=1 Tax=Helobdella robusta TaxID=6412 RepID=T1G660_HELRO